MNYWEALEILEKDLKKYFNFEKKNVGDGLRFVNIINEFLDNIKEGE